jgi:predicted metal-dependent TIM-barrel fold hydrolase
VNFEEAFYNSDLILMEGGLGERLKREYNIEVDKDIALAGHIYDSRKRKALAELFEQYFNVAKMYNMPIIVTTPTRRANKERISSSIFKQNNVIEDNVNFLKQLK